MHLPRHFAFFSPAQRIFSLAFALCAPIFCAADIPPNQPGLLKREDIFKNPPFPECHASTLLPLKDGGLLMACFAGSKEMNPDVAIWTARYESGQWQPPVEVADGQLTEAESAHVAVPALEKDCLPVYRQTPIRRVAAWNPVLFRMKDGSIALFYKLGTHPQTWWGMRINSYDEGKTWSKPERLPDGIYGPIKNKPVRLKDGTILSPTSVEDEKGWRVYFEASADEGKTWTKTPCVPSDPGIQAIQPSVLIHPDGTLQAVGRTRAAKNDGFVFQTFSTDNGKTWSPLTSTPLPNNNSGTDAVTLKDGTHLIVYNHTTQIGRRKRTPLNVAMSSDGARWYAALVLENEPVGEFSYPAIVQSDDGLVHVVYSADIKNIRHVMIDPSLLKKGLFLTSIWNR